MKILFLSVLLAYFVVPGTALKCFRCGISPSLCFLKETCKENELCFSGNTTVAGVTFFNSGCINKDKCGKPFTDSTANIQYTVTAECCDFDNCNGATATQISVLTISIMLLVWFVGFQ